jgi:Asp-tRNA(Asn)/Glu-tRNA(Gln) amidotransferase A subunit family amidase
MMSINYDPKQVVQEAINAANAAGEEWIKNAKPQFSVHNADLFGNIKGPSLGTMLDICGNAHLQFKDGRSADYKTFVKAGLIRSNNNKVVEIYHRYKLRQEYGLQIACVEAEKKVFEQYGIMGVHVWSYVD